MLAGGEALARYALHRAYSVLANYPHGICPVDDVVIDGRGVIDESYLTEEPFQIPKTFGSMGSPTPAKMRGGT